MGDVSPRRPDIASAAPFTLPPLYVIADADVCGRAGWTLDDFAAACLDGGAAVIQIRAKQASSRSLLEIAERVARRAEGTGALVIVNDRADVARLARAGGVHVGQDDLAPALVRRIVGAETIVGLSTHTSGQIAQAVREPISYFAIGPVFGTVTKSTGYAAVGLERVREAAAAGRSAGLPVVAIGGITIQNASSAIDAGASAVAVITDLLVTGDPGKQTRAYLERLAPRLR